MESLWVVALFWYIISAFLIWGSFRIFGPHFDYIVWDIVQQWYVLLLIRKCKYNRSDNWLGHHDQLERLYFPGYMFHVLLIPVKSVARVYISLLWRFLSLLFCKKSQTFCGDKGKVLCFCKFGICQISVIIYTKYSKTFRKSIEGVLKKILKKKIGTSDYQFFFYYFIVLRYIFNLIWHTLSQVVAFLSI